MQNEKTLQQMIREYETNMPPEIMELINAFDWKRELRMISQQNQLMADVAADLEESVYLMLLGVVKVSDVFERMIDIHELSQDRVRKVLEEVENRIFNVLHKKLTELDEKEAEPVILKTPTAPILGKINPVTPKDDDRDTILAEIEKDEVDDMIIKPMDKSTVIPPATNSTVEVKSMPISTPVIGMNTLKPIMNNPSTIQNPGVAKPFSLNTEKTADTTNMSVSAPEVVKGIQNDPIVAGLNKATVMSAPIVNTNPTPAPKAAGAPDPYREPIE